MDAMELDMNRLTTMPEGLCHRADPTDETDVFTASITIVDGKVKVSYTPELDDARKALRKYTTWGKEKLTDKDWSVVGEGEEGNFDFFRVTVEMR